MKQKKQTILKLQRFKLKEAVQLYVCILQSHPICAAKSNKITISRATIGHFVVAVLCFAI